MKTSNFVAAAGVDPYVKAADVVSGRPGEVSALGEAFVTAAEALGESGSLAGLGGELADASTVFDGKRPTDLMLELVAVSESLNATPSQLYGIGTALCDLATELSSAQLAVGDQLASMEEQCVAVIVEFETAYSVEPTPETKDAYKAKGAAVVEGAYTQIAATVDAYDAVVNSVLITVQAAGYILPPDVDAGIAGSGGGVPGSMPIPASTDPVAVANWWATLSPEEQAAMMQTYGPELAALPGLPAAVYDVLNRNELADSQIGLEQKIAQLLDELTTSGALSDEVKKQFGIESNADILAMSPQRLVELGGFVGPIGRVILAELKDVRKSRAKIDKTQDSIADTEGGQQAYLLEYEFGAYGGDGAVVIGLGEVDTADHVATVVQGATHSAYTIDKQTEDGQAVLDQMKEQANGDSTAVIVYAGYDNPDVIQAMGTGRANDGGEMLNDFLASQQAAHQQATGDDAHTTVIGHSYGTVVVSEALQDGANKYVDDVVVFGSPGMGVDSVADLGMDKNHVYAAMDDDDILLQLEGLDEAWDVDLFHGPPTTTEEFGATVTGTWGVDSHGEYFSYQDGKPTESLANAGAVATGNYDDVTLED